MNRQQEEYGDGTAVRGDSQPISEKSTTELETEIEKIRAEMNSTLDDIEQRFSAGDLFDRLLHYLSSTPGDYPANFGRALRENPLPAVLSGIGLIWLAFDAAGRQAESEGKWKTGTSSHHSWKERSKSLRTRLKLSGESLRERREQALLEKRWAIQAAGGRFRFQVARTRRGFSYLLQEKPMVLALMGVSVGVLIGSVMPLTGRETELMGKAGEDLRTGMREDLRREVASGRRSAGGETIRVNRPLH